MIRALPRIRTTPKREPFPLLKLIFVWPLLLVAWLVSDDTPRRHFDGMGTDDGTLKPYDSLTRAEHDEIGAVWDVDLRGDE